jgi:hypothetical protein
MSAWASPCWSCSSRVTRWTTWNTSSVIVRASEGRTPALGRRVWASRQPPPLELLQALLQVMVLLQVLLQVMVLLQVLLQVLVL